MIRLGPMFAFAIVSLLAQQPDAIFKQAIEAHQKGDLDTAIAKYREFLKQRPSSIEARSNLGAALVRKGEYDAAIEEYQIALKDASSNPGISLNLALAYYKKGELRRAASELNALRAATGGIPQA